MPAVIGPARSKTIASSTAAGGSCREIVGGNPFADH
jgi:hypothetical protein